MVTSEYKYSLNNFFKNFENSYHIPSFSLMKYIYKDAVEDKRFVAYHPYSQSFIELNQIEALVLKLIELGRTPHDIASVLNINENTIYTIANEFYETISSLKPNEILKYDVPDTLWLIIPSCNMRCKYCYVAGGAAFPTTKVEASKIISIIDNVVSIFPTINYLVFFGGEPLTEFSIIKAIVEKFNGLLRFGIVTNATLIDNEILEFLDSYKDVIDLTISIDGPKVVHDLNRVYRDGKGTYKRVIKSIEMLKDHEITFDIEATYTYEAMELGYTILDVVKYLSEFSPYIIIKPSDYVITLNAGLRFEHSFLANIIIDYVSAAIRELLSTRPRFYDLALSVALAMIGRRATKVVACPFMRFITILPNGSITSCHMLIDLVLNNDHSNTDFEKVIRQWFNNTLLILKQYTKCIDARDTWFMSIQDICPAELFGGLRGFIDGRVNCPVRIPMYIKSIIESFWDSIIINVYRLQYEDKLDTVYDNVSKMMSIRRRRYKVE